MAFNGSEGEAIDLKLAGQWTKNYRNQHPDEAKAHFFGKSIIEQILAQEGCMGIRIYYGIDHDNQKQLIMVGTDGNEDDIENGIVADVSIICPPYCGKPNNLNT